MNDPRDLDVVVCVAHHWLTLLIRAVSDTYFRDLAIRTPLEHLQSYEETVGDVLEEYEPLTKET